MRYWKTQAVSAKYSPISHENYHHPADCVSSGYASVHSAIPSPSPFVPHRYPMNQTFDIHRFVLMLRFDAAEKGRNYLMMAGVLVFCILAMTLPITQTSEPSEFLRILHFGALFMITLFGASLFTSTAFSQYSDQSNGIAALMIPASRLEKYFSSLLLNLAFVIPFLIFFWQLHYWTIDFANTLLPTGGGSYAYIPKDLFEYTTCSYIVIQASIFLGSIYFKKFAYIKTAVVAIAFGSLLSYFNYSMAIKFASKPSKFLAYPLSGWKVWFYTEEGMERPKYFAGFYHIQFSETMEYAAQGFAVWLAIMLWICAYYQMKEREI